MPEDPQIPLPIYSRTSRYTPLPHSHRLTAPPKPKPKPTSLCQNPLFLARAILLLLARTNSEEHTAGRTKEEKKIKMATPGKCFLLTGPSGIGKTTLVMKVLESLKISIPSLKVQGFYTREVRHGTERVGFEVVTLDGRRGPLASTTYSSAESLRWPSVGKYKVDTASFESLAMPELQVKEDTELFIIDEVGKMELYSASFFPAVLKVLESNIPILATIPIPKFGRDIPGVARLRNHPGAAIFTLNKLNRDSIKEEICTKLANLLQKQ